jgi:hypothetical protein
VTVIHGAKLIIHYVVKFICKHNFYHDVNANFSPFTEGIHDLADHFKADEEIKDAYTTFSEHLEEINSFYSVGCSSNDHMKLVLHVACLLCNDLYDHANSACFTAPQNVR